MKGTKLSITLNLTSLKVLFISTEFLTNDYLKMRTAPAACDFRVITARKH